MAGSACHHRYTKRLAAPHWWLATLCKEEAVKARHTRSNTYSAEASSAFHSRQWFITVALPRPHPAAVLGRLADGKVGDGERSVTGWPRVTLVDGRGERGPFLLPLLRAGKASVPAAVTVRPRRLCPDDVPEWAGLPCGRHTGILSLTSQ